MPPSLTKRIIYISGIGADGRAFSKLDIEGGCEHVYVEWIPFEKSESLDSYCLRLIEAYSIGPEDALVGVSFGGLLSQKISTLLGNQKVVVLSSFRSKKDLRILWNYCLRLRLHFLFPPFRIPFISVLVTVSLNARSLESRQTTTAMLKNSDFKFIRWALQKIAKADLKDVFSENYLVLNGDRDILVKNWQVQNATTIRGGSHFMVFDHAAQISPIIQRYLQD